MSDDLLDEAYSRFEKNTHVTLATVEGNQPRLRTITLIYDEEGFFFATGTSSQKVSHVRENPFTEFILNLKQGENKGYLRGECIANIVGDQDFITRLFHENAFMSKLWNGPEDPNLTIIELKPVVFYYLRPGDWTSIKIEIK